MDIDKLKPIPCELCERNVLKGTIYKARIQNALYAFEANICESCRNAVLNAKQDYYNGKGATG